MWSGSRAIADAVPHEYPFQMLDRLVQRETGRWAVAEKCVGLDQESVDAAGAIPRALLLECLAQAAGLAAVAEAGEGGAVVAAVDRFRARFVWAGDRLVVVARVVKRYGKSAKVRAYARKENQWVAAADLVMRFG
jgi:3-hydroxymyristoyl/3-hydroxydecanoyl-(acyl carrier protein) dehydratase